MAPQHRSLLVELLSKNCDYEVVGAEDGVEIKPSTVYVNTPNTDISVVDGRLHISLPSDDVGAKPSIDKLFKSLAINYGSRSIAVVLSGTGSDGTQGFREVRDAGGITIAQQPDTAKYNGMPNSAIRARLADLILSPEEIANYLSDSHHRPEVLKSVGKDEETVVSVDTLIERILTETGLDFRQYKRATLERQLQRRMSALRLNSIDDYFAHVDKDPDELEVVQRSFLISVTSFFRDEEAFEALGKVLDNIIKQAEQSGSIRIWVPACATGEEVYTIAIMLAERLGATLRGFNVKIFATDINELNLDVARQGVYVDAAVENLTPEVLSTYFDLEANKYRIKKWVRDMCMFARHDLVKDPSFLRMNLVSCRNLMIYLNNPLQDQLVNNFHYALNPGGYLFLGKSESIGSTGDKLFDFVDKSNKLYKRKPGAVSYGRFSGALVKGINNTVQSLKNTNNPTPAHRIEEKVFSALIDSFAPPSIQLSDQFQPIKYFGDISPYLKINPGKANFDIVSLSHPQIQTEVRALINRVSRGEQDKIDHIVRFKFPDDVTSTVNISVQRVVDNISETQAYLMSFNRIVETPAVSTDNPPKASADAGVVEELEEELQRTRDHLQAVVEELETSNEELQALNEELQASTEELQASNEELETTNEELQATNEELTTVNDELQAKSILLTDSNETLVNIQRSLDMGLIVVDTDHRVARFTPQAVRLFGILPDDVGHKLTKLPRHIDVPDFEKLLDNVIQTGSPVRRELESKGEKYLMNISPYRRDQGIISGAVLTFTETTKLSESIDHASLVDAMLNEVGKVISEGVMILAPGFAKILHVSQRLEQITMRNSDVLLRDSETFLDIVDHGDRERVANHYKDSETQGWDMTYKIKRRDGSIVKVHDVAKREEVDAHEHDIITSIIRVID
ncbi:Chemotaxis protein methyltransferase [Marinobacterium sp. xm-a-127]|nr:Chemotaxis protein methyltransferase [Marinobacterium sp. xm-d-420]NRP56957.1 Chemotaxis protein methyltransferase [Marinobacterium sp. xm-d-510]NRP94099.1 Chemotaxis protein methyltransferase [Marinobacterium sp. xm-g-59]NRP97793.1 Chemotaxis protein methyltransferase [Marinobacterium sp. xm-a-127]